VPLLVGVMDSNALYSHTPIPIHFLKDEFSYVAVLFNSEGNIEQVIFKTDFFFQRRCIWWCDDPSFLDDLLMNTSSHTSSDILQPRYL